MTAQILTLPREGETVGSGVVESLINTGGSAAVYKTWVEHLEVYRAVKVMHPDALNEIRDRIKTEARISSKLLHQNIVHVYNYGETASGLPFLEMDFVKGATLANLISTNGALSLKCTLAATIGILEGLHHAHTLKYTLYKREHAGVMHRDIKPSNVIISEDTGHARLMDFGIARPVAVSIHTMAGNSPGTIAYMSPEALVNNDYDKRSDIYQVGVLMYECLSGVPAFGQTDIQNLLRAKCANKYEPIDTDHRAAAIINKCMQRDPAKRYQSALECLRDVRALFNTLCPHLEPEELLKHSYDRGAMKPFSSGTIPRVRTIKHRKRIKQAIAAAACLVFTAGIVTAGIRYRSYIESAAIAAAHAFATLSDSTAAEEDIRTDNGESFAVVGPDETEQATEPTPEQAAQPTAANVATVPPVPRTQQASAPPPPRNVSTTAAAPKARPQQQAAATAPQDAALALIHEGKSLYTAGQFAEALIKYNTAINTPSSAPRQEIIRQSLYGSARSTTALYKAGQTPRENYLAAWRSVAGVFPAGTPEHNEAQSHLENV